MADIGSGEMAILVLREGEYVRSSTSRAIGVLTDETLTQLVADRERLASSAWFQHVLRWARDRSTGS